MWGKVSSQSVTGLCNLKMSVCSKKAHITVGSHNRHIIATNLSNLVNVGPLFTDL